MPTGMGLLRQQRGPFAKSFVLLASGGATREIEIAGKVLAIFALRLLAVSATASSASWQDQAGTVLWLQRVPATANNSTVIEFDPPLISYDGLQVVTAGAASLDVTAEYSLVDET
jgi:hypothetical protein